MDLNGMIQTLKRHPQFHAMGMIASHLGIVRGHSLKGGQVKAIEVVFDPSVIDRIVKETKSMNGIVDVLVEVNPGRLSVGDEVMAVAVGGDTREHVFPALELTVNRIKAEASRKQEIFQGDEGGH